MIASLFVKNLLEVLLTGTGFVSGLRSICKSYLLVVSVLLDLQQQVKVGGSKCKKMQHMRKVLSFVA